MNEKKAKQLRKQIYKNDNFRERKYVRHKRTRVVYVIGKRKEYQNAKKEYYRNRRIV